ncbi:MAG: GNAT family N-acetyltransferase [Gammaproteobacteria bacterium]|nr:GNAT family N-acetyltransferase [Gammaproteobacteria bacterium]
MTLAVRPANSRDTEAAVKLVRRSITELCTADHRDDAATLDQWLANKTPENFRAWISDPDNFCVVAEDAGVVHGAGLLHRDGEIRLMYLAPGSQRQGTGRAIHAALETQARTWGLRMLFLDSTSLARSFYEALGYRATGEAKPRFGVLMCYPYEKPLQY